MTQTHYQLLYAGLQRFVDYPSASKLTKAMGKYMRSVEDNNNLIVGCTLHWVPERDDRPCSFEGTVAWETTR